MQQPEVCAVCVTANRLEFTRAAISDFRAQSYPNKSLVVWDTSDTRDVHAALIEDMRDREYYVHDSGRLVIGQLRNRANSYACSGEGFAVPGILMHLDSDDRNHPNRIAEQVAMLEFSGAQAVGYNELLFWREPEVKIGKFRRASGDHSDTYTCPGEAYLYTNKDQRYPPGSSLCYWRKTWEAKPFAATSMGEDLRFCTGLKVVSVSSIGADGAPRMAARIHSGNTSNAYRPEAMARAKEWRRIPERDEELRGLFATSRL